MLMPHMFFDNAGGLKIRDFRGGDVLFVSVRQSHSLREYPRGFLKFRKAVGPSAIGPAKVHGGGGR